MNTIRRIGLRDFVVESDYIIERIKRKYPDASEATVKELYESFEEWLQDQVTYNHLIENEIDVWSFIGDEIVDKIIKSNQIE